jgi:hypothetical protein
MCGALFTIQVLPYRVGSRVTNVKIVAMPNMVKHSSLLQVFINCSRKKF